MIDPRDDDIDLSGGIRQAIQGAAAPDIDPAMEVMRLLGVRGADIARAMGRSPQLICDWAAGRAQPTPVDRARLVELAGVAVAAALDTIGETAIDHPGLIGTAGWARYVARVREARSILAALYAAGGGGDAP